MVYLTKRKVKKYIREAYDLNFLSRIQPVGNIDFRTNDSFWKQGGIYHMVTHIPYDGYPETGLPDLWQQSILMQENVATLISLEHASNRDLSERASKAISNMLHSSNRNSTDDFDDQSQISSLLDFRDRLKNNIPSKLMRTQMHVTGTSEDNLKQNVSDMKSRLSQFKISENDGMQDVERRSAFVPPEREGALPTRRLAQPISVLDLGAGYPFNHTSLSDPHGIYLGQTPTKGAVNFNLLHSDDYRDTPTLLIAGRNRTDKEKILGKYLDAMFAKGHTIINIDLKGTLLNLTKKQCGRVVSMHGEDNANLINMMQVLATQSLSDGLKDDPDASFRDQRSKLKSYAQMINPELTTSDLNNLGSAISELYEELGLLVSGGEFITNLVYEDYPILGDLIEKLESLCRTSQQEGEGDKSSSYRKLFDAFSVLLENYRFLDQVSTYEDFSDEKVITFDLSGLQNDELLLNIQLFQVLSVAMSLAVNNGKINKQWINEGNVAEKDQFNHCVITVTGAEKLFNPNFSESLRFLAKMIQNVSDNFGAFILEMSSLESILLPSSEISTNPYVRATREVFMHMRYRLFSQVDTLTIPLLANALQGEMTSSELSSLKYMRRGQFFLNIATLKNIMFTRYLSSDADVDQWGDLYSEQSRYADLQ
ncbi:TPA: hypothetical protein ACQ0F8_001618 [Streptococcus agalactiae]|nr:hypothetical protein [Streptococcus agalactiae]HEO4177427.1 hypothetical protein [Streptococcus agalactiae]